MKENGDGIEPRGKLDRNRSALLILLSTVAGIGYLAVTHEGEGEKPKPGRVSVSATEAKHLRERGEACGVLVKTDAALWRFERRRQDVVRQLWELGLCSNPSAKEFNFNDVCMKVAEGKQKYRVLLKNPVWHMFYRDLYDDLKCAMREKEYRPEHREALERIVRAFEKDDAVKEYRLLDPQADIKTLCLEALEEVNEPGNLKNLKTIVTYLFEKRTALPEGSKLKEVFESARTRFRETHGEQLDDTQLDAAMQEKYDYVMGWAKTAAATWGVRATCYLPIENILTWLGTSTTPDRIAHNRSLALPLLRDVFTLLKDESDDARAAEVTDALAALARNLVRTKR